MESKHHIYVDFENVQNIRLQLIAGKPVTVTLVLGSRQKSLPVELTQALLEYAPQVRLVETKASGKNALDFVLACELGGRCATDQQSGYYIVSRDKGFDAIIDHLTQHRIRVARYESFAGIPVLKPESRSPGIKKPTPPTLEERVRDFTEKLERSPANRPARTKTLLSTIHAFFGRDLTDVEVQAIVDRLTVLKKIRIGETGAVTYSL